MTNDVATEAVSDLRDKINGHVMIYEYTKDMEYIQRISYFQIDVNF